MAELRPRLRLGGADLEFAGRSERKLVSGWASEIRSPQNRAPTSATRASHITPKISHKMTKSALTSPGQPVFGRTAAFTAEFPIANRLQISSSNSQRKMLKP